MGDPDVKSDGRGWTQPRKLLGRIGNAYKSGAAADYARLDRALRRSYAFLRWRYPIAGVALLAAVLIVGAWLAWRGVNAYVDPRTAGERSDLIRAVAQIGGGLLLLIGLYFTARTLRINQQALRLNEQGQVTERYTRAIDQLGAPDKDGNKVLEVRLGAIYALERIARDSPKDRPTIIEVLSAYVRENAQRPPVHPLEEEEEADIDPSDPRNWAPERPGGPTAPADIQAALIVLGRRDRPPESYRRETISLDRADLRHADLSDLDFRWDTFAHTDLRGTHLYHTRLAGSLLSYTNMQNLDLQSAQLRGAWFFHTDLEGANMTAQDLRHADFGGCHLRGARFDKANLHGAAFNDAVLLGASFAEAKLTGVTFGGASLSDTGFRDANLDGADLRGVVLSRAKRLTWDQVRRARWDEETEFPDGLRPPDSEPVTEPSE